jgi:hypothetical protein
VADEKDSANGSVRRGSWDPVLTTVQLELFGLSFSGIVALVGWPFGWLPDPGLVGLMTGMTAASPAVELYRAGAPRRLAVVAALLTLGTVTLLVAAAANRVFPALDDPDVGILIGFLVAGPAAVAVLARLLDRSDTTDR